MTTVFVPTQAKTGWVLALIVMLALLASCGGVGEEGTDVQSDGTDQTVNVGILKELDGPNLMVNDVIYDRRQAVVTNGFGDVVSEQSLRLGMWLEIGSASTDDQGRLIARTIRIRPSARGKVTDIDNESLAVNLLNATARYINDTTVLAGVDSIEALSAGDIVEVHGPLGAGDGTVEASRLAKLLRQAANTRPVELRGRVRRLNRANSTMTVGRQPVSYAQASVTLRRALNNGQVVRVSASQEPTPGQAWQVDRLTEDQPLPENIGFAYAQGVVTDFQAGPLFTIEDLPVNAKTANGRGRVKNDGQRVAVIGAIRGGVLNAKSVAVIAPGKAATFVLGGRITRYETTARFRVRGVEINASKADFVDGTPRDLTDRRRVRVTGRIVGRRLIASRVVLLN